MSEEETIQENKKEETKEDSGTGDKSKAVGILNEANEIYEKLGERNREYKELIEREEEMRASDLLRGKSQANIEENKPKEETPSEYRDRILKGNK